MRYLTDRTDIAKAINLDENLVVLEIDVANEIILGGDMVCGYRGCLAKKPRGQYYVRGKIEYFKDTKFLRFSENCVCLSNSFGYRDVKEMLEYRKAPMLTKGCRCLLVAYNSKTGQVLSPIEFEYDGNDILFRNAEWLEQLEA